MSRILCELWCLSARLHLFTVTRLVWCCSWTEVNLLPTGWVDVYFKLLMYACRALRDLYGTRVVVSYHDEVIITDWQRWLLLILYGKHWAGSISQWYSLGDYICNEIHNCRCANQSQPHRLFRLMLTSCIKQYWWRVVALNHLATQV